MLIESDVRIQILSEPDFEWIVADVFYKDKYMFLLSLKGEVSLDIEIHLPNTSEVVEPFAGALPLADYLAIIEYARDRYIYRLTEGRNPFA